jgi:hypothetical protein
MMGKLKETQQNGRNKKRLDTVLVDAKYRRFIKSYYNC